jgi:DNA-directed RNA polymerase specialized sigma24 family protein
MARKSRILSTMKPVPDMLLLDEPAEDERWIHDQLVRWAVWCRPAYRPSQACSAEGRYVAPKGNIYDPPEPKLMYSVEEARMVNRALLQLSEHPRAVLRARYYERLPDQLLCRRHNVKHSDYRSTLRNYRLLLLNHLRAGADQA